MYVNPRPIQEDVADIRHQLTTIRAALMVGKNHNGFGAVGAIMSLLEQIEFKTNRKQGVIK